MIIETSNLIIEPISKETLKNILNDMDNLYNIPIPKHPSNYQIKKFLEFNNKIIYLNSIGYMSIKFKKTSDVVGLISIIPRYINDSLINELGYFTLKKYRKNGIISEAILGSLEFIFTKTTINKIYSLVDKNNKISTHILKNKLNFDFCGIFVDINSTKDVYYVNKEAFLNSLHNKRTLI